MKNIEHRYLLLPFILIPLLLATTGCIPTNRRFQDADALKNIELASCERVLTQENAVSRTDCINGVDERWYQRIGNPYMAQVYQSSAAIKLAAVDYHEGKISQDRFLATVDKIRAEAGGTIIEKLENKKDSLIARDDEQRRFNQMREAQTQNQKPFQPIIRTSPSMTKIQEPIRTRCEKAYGLDIVNCETR